MISQHAAALGGRQFHGLVLLVRSNVDVECWQNTCTLHSHGNQEEMLLYWSFNPQQSGEYGCSCFKLSRKEGYEDCLLATVVNQLVLYQHTVLSNTAHAACHQCLLKATDTCSVTFKEVLVRGRGGCNGYGMWERQYSSTSHTDFLRLS